MQKTWGLNPWSGRSPGEGNGNPLHCSCLENPRDRGAWRGYSPWGCKESDRTEQLSFSLWLPRYSSTATQENNLNNYLTDTTSEKRSDFDLIKNLTEKKKRIRMHCVCPYSISISFTSLTRTETAWILDNVYRFPQA